MSLSHWIHLFTGQMQQTTFWEWLAVLLGVGEVFLAKVNNIWLYPVGIAGTLLGIYFFLVAGLYADSALNVYYVVMSAYGWYYWVKKRNEPPVKISRANKSEWIVTFYITFGGWAVLYVILKYFTPSTVPVWDSFVSATAWAGMWLLARRKLENWILLNISNLFAVPLLLYKQLPLFAILTFTLFIVAFFGFFQWLGIWKENKMIENKKVSPPGGDLEGAGK